MTSLPYDLIERDAPQIGLIVLQADESLERDMVRLLPEGTELLVTRVPSGTAVTSATLQAMADALTDAAGRLPRDTTFAAVGYGCTSGTAQIGIKRIKDLVIRGVHAQTVTEPVSALIAACRHMSISRLGLISPYTAAVSDTLRAVIAQAGVTVTDFRSFDEPTEHNVARIAPQSIKKAAMEMGLQSDCDAVFLSCTNLRTLDIIDDIEQAIGKPVLSSNQVLGWHLGQLAGLSLSSNAPGQLFR